MDWDGCFVVDWYGCDVVFGRVVDEVVGVG